MVCGDRARAGAPALCWLLALSLAGCSPRGHAAGAPEEPARPAAAETPLPDETVPSPDPALPEEPSVPLAQTRRGSIPRAALDTVLDRGPGAFLRNLSIKPRFHEHRFAGWEIVALTPGELPLERVDLRPGDVVVSVNGRPIVRPHHLSDLWVELRSADAIVIRVQRSGKPFDLYFQVVNDNQAPP